MRVPAGKFVIGLMKKAPQPYENIYNCGTGLWDAQNDLSHMGIDGVEEAGANE